MINNLKWFLAGMLCTGAIAIAAAPTVLEQVLNGVQTYSLEDTKFWVGYDSTIFTERQCWYVDPTRIAGERVRLGRTPMVNYLDMTRQKIGISEKIANLTPDQKVFCDWLVTGLGTPTSEPAPPTPPPAPTTSIDNTMITAPSGSIVTPTDTWTFGPAKSIGGNALLRNGTIAAGGYGNQLLWKGGVIYTFTLDAKWFKWIGTGWITVAPPVQ